MSQNVYQYGPKKPNYVGNILVEERNKAQRRLRRGYDSSYKDPNVRIRYSLLNTIKLTPEEEKSIEMQQMANRDGIRNKQEDDVYIDNEGEPFKDPIIKSYNHDTGEGERPYIRQDVKEREVKDELPTPGEEQNRQGNIDSRNLAQESYLKNMMNEHQKISDSRYDMTKKENRHLRDDIKDNRDLLQQLKRNMQRTRIPLSNNYQLPDDSKTYNYVSLVQKANANAYYQENLFNSQF
jgi:hypothetical protein